MKSMMTLIMDLRHYLRAPFAEDNGVLGMMKNYKEWEASVAQLLEQNDRLQREVEAAQRQRDELTRAVFNFEVMEDGSMSIDTKPHRYVGDMNLSADTEIVVRSTVRAEVLRRIGESAVRTERELREREERRKAVAK